MNAADHTCAYKDGDSEISKKGDMAFSNKKKPLLSAVDFNGQDGGI